MWQSTPFAGLPFRRRRLGASSQPHYLYLHANLGETPAQLCSRFTSSLTGPEILRWSHASLDTPEPRLMYALLYRLYRTPQLTRLSFWIHLEMTPITVAFLPFDANPAEPRRRKRRPFPRMFRPTPPSALATLALPFHPPTTPP